ncbi:MAG: gamma-glutamyltransferase [Bradyrhizobium sp.]
MGWFNARPDAANSIAGRKRPLANMGPMLVTRDGQAVAAIGAPGGRRIISCVVQLIINLCERGMSAESAISAPRLDASGHALLASEELAGVLDGAANDRVTWSPVATQHAPFGYELARPVLVTRDGTGELRAVTDPRVRGSAFAL